MTLFANTIPVTAASPPGGRPRRGEAPANAFATWLSSQSRSVREIANLLGLTRWTIYHLRNGYHQPSLEVAKKIAEMSRPVDPATGAVGDPAVPEASWPPPIPRNPKPKSKTRKAKSRRRRSTRG
jgi:DNA-binding XRE family transcriptional regulator